MFNLDDFNNILTESDIVDMAETFSANFLNENRAIDAVILAKRLDQFAEVLRDLNVQIACTQIDDRVTGAEVKFRKGATIYKFSETVENWEKQIKANQEKLKEEKVNEIKNKVAVAIDTKPGTLAVTLPKS